MTKQSPLNDQHTPGPWKRFGNYKILDATGALVAEVTKNGLDDPEVDANARLIAASPDLADMLDQLIELMPTDDINDGYHYDRLKRVEEARRVLRKAKGE